MTDPEHITFDAGPYELHADVHEGDGEWAALIIHGWTGWRGGSSGALAKELAGRSLAASLCVELPGHGDSDGDRNSVTPDEFLAAGDAAYDQLAQRYPDRRILVVGTSFGGWLAARLVERRSVDALALRVPANYHPYDLAVQAVHEFDGPVFVLEAENDEVIPPDMVQEYVEAATNVTYELLAGAPHSISTAPDKLTDSNELLADWLHTLS